MYTVTCPVCNTKNHGYAIECEKCNNSLEGLQRIETAQPEPRFWTHIYDLYVYGNDSLTLNLPPSNCFDCFSDKPAKTYKDYVPATSINTSLGSAGGTGVRVTETSRDLTLEIPLCANCYNARKLFDANYDPKFYDPTCRENPSVKRASMVVGILFAVSLITTILWLIINSSSSIGGYLFFSTIILAIAFPTLNRLSSSFDRKLKKGLCEEVDRRYQWYVRGLKAEDLNKKLFGKSRLAWHFQIQFQNEQYWELFNQIKIDKMDAKEEESKQFLSSQSQARVDNRVSEPNLLTQDQLSGIKDLVRQGRKMDAIKLARQYMNIKMVDAKDYIDQLERENNTESVQQTMA